MREKNDLGRRWQSSRHLATGDPVGRLMMLSPPVYDLYTVKAQNVRAVGPAKKVGMALDSESRGDLALGLRLRGPASAPRGVQELDQSAQLSIAGRDSIAAMLASLLYLVHRRSDGSVRPG